MAAAVNAAAGDFPLGFYGINAPAELAVLKRAGFDSFHTYNQDPERLSLLAAEAKRQGMKMLAYPDRVIGSAYEAEAKRWPVLAWYLFDEPEVRRLPLAKLQELEARVKAWDKNARTVFVMGEGIAAFTYGGAADALMVDWYPVPHLPLGSVGEQVSMVKAGAAIQDPVRQNKPVWAVLQAFDWIHYPQRRKVRVGGFPSFEALRYMTWLAVARGAEGVFYFKYDGSDGIPLPERPGRWNNYQRMAAEINALRPALRKGRPGTVPAGLPEGLAARALKRGLFGSYLILLNPTAAPLPLPDSLKSWRPLFEMKRELPPALPPHGVLILEK
ncbi:MAG: hypothetical protein CVU79_00140 [Elusimicrobia bacterium HGW-Elusimicrobia-3]|nr:MAG: hypothetical protein CVU79_00140 [Elusimicrobia bacterium HGW-Elusimicrobia-3]